MARRSTGHEVLQKAQGDVASAATADQLRAALAVTLPLVLGLSLAQTAEVIGKTPAWVGRTRMRYIKGPRKEKLPEKRGGRRHSAMSLEDERRYVELASTVHGWGSPTARLAEIVVSHRLGQPLSRSAIYKMFRRHSGYALVEQNRRLWQLKVEKEHQEERERREANPEIALAEEEKRRENKRRWLLRVEGMKQEAREKREAKKK
jgi:hypothetical protein